MSKPQQLVQFYHFRQTSQPGHSSSVSSVYLTISGYLVNKPLQATGMSADNVRGWEIVRKMNIWPRTRSFEGECEILRTISQPRTLSADKPASQKGVYLFYNPPINFHTFQHACQFCRLHVYKCGWNFSLFPQSMLNLHENGYFIVSKHNVLNSILWND